MVAGPPLLRTLVNERFETKVVIATVSIRRLLTVAIRYEKRRWVAVNGLR